MLRDIDHTDPWAATDLEALSHIVLRSDDDAPHAPLLLDLLSIRLSLASPALVYAFHVMMMFHALILDVSLTSSVYERAVQREGSAPNEAARAPRLASMNAQ